MYTCNNDDTDNVNFKNDINWSAPIDAFVIPFLFEYLSILDDLLKSHNSRKA